MLDVMLRGGTVIDGTGAPMVRADVGIAGDTITEVGDLGSAWVRQIVDCSGLYVAPGFIDMHSHYDLRLFTEPEAPAKIRQGVTCDLLGQDGISVAPISERNIPQVREQLSGLLGNPDITWSWRSVQDYLGALDGKIGMNVAYLVPHGALRWEVMGFEARQPTARELDAMRGLLRDSLQAGGVGFSTGLIYPPCCFADQEELTRLNEVTAREGGFLVVHMRSESDFVLEALQEMIAVSRDSGAPLHLSHFKASGRANWPKLARMIELIEARRAAGQDITCDQYPYEAGSTMLGALLPPWAHDGGQAKVLERLADRATREKMRAEIEATEISRWENFTQQAGYEGILITSLNSEKNRPAIGKTVADIARLWAKPPAEVVFDLLLEERMGVTMVIFSQSEANVALAMRASFQMVGSDGILGGKPHPRVFGTFPRVLGRYVRERKLLTWEDAIHRMTGKPAARLRFPDRGRIAPGMKADLTVFDPATVVDRGTYQNPTPPPDGIAYVFVNGKLACERGQITGALAGRALTH